MNKSDHGARIVATVRVRNLMQEQPGLRRLRQPQQEPARHLYG